MSRARTFLPALLFCVVLPSSARADGLIIPFVGVNFGGRSGQDLSTAIDRERLDWGVSASFMTSGILGLEADVAHSPDFFGRSDIGGSSVLTASGNVVVGVPIGGQHGVGFRPYAVAGLGLLHSNIDLLGEASHIDQTKAAWDFGGGAMVFFANHVGVRGELRYFRTFGRFDVDGSDQQRRLDFARASAGFVMRF